MPAVCFCGCALLSKWSWQRRPREQGSKLRAPNTDAQQAKGARHGRTCFFCSSLVGRPAAFCRWSYIIFS
ncbi:MAG: hypothetical protein ACK55Z_30265, partial [bacterium]